MHPSVAFDDVARVLEDGSSGVHPAEAHGALCGALCLRPDYAYADWLEEILPDAAIPDSRDQTLPSLYADSCAVLAEGEMNFEPLLPDDESDLASRVESLAAWCQGFLYGFGASGLAARTPLPADVDEVLADLARISQAGGVGSEAADVEEASYAELVEFVRAAVQLVYDELDALRRSQPHSGQRH